MAHLTKVATLADSILRQMAGIGRCQHRFIVHLVALWLSIRGRHNFTNLGRYGAMAEGTYRDNFKSDFDWLTFNTQLVKQHLGDRLILAVDPSYLPKSGKHTAGVGKFWSGQAGQVKPGLEICGIAAVDLDTKTAMHLIAFQTVNQQADETLLGFYTRGILQRAQSLQQSSKYVVADAYFAKAPFIDPLCLAGFEVITRLRRDAHLRYLSPAAKTGKRGRPKQYDGRVDPLNLRDDYFECCARDEQEEGRWVAYTAVVNVKSWKRKVRLVVVHHLDDRGKVKSYRLLISTDEGLQGLEIVTMYAYRFQQEFLFRDAKQELGLTHCQAYSSEKIDFHVNTALTVGSLAKAAHATTDEVGRKQPFSIADVKTEYVNEHQGLRLLSMFGIDVNNAKIRKLLAAANNYGKRRA